MWDWLSGKKTYIVSATMAISSILGFTSTGGITAVIPLILEFVTSPEMMNLLTAGGMATIRHGVSK